MTAPKDQLLRIRVDRDTLASLNQLAQVTNTDVSAAVRMALALGLPDALARWGREGAGW